MVTVSGNYFQPHLIKVLNIEIGLRTITKSQTIFKPTELEMWLLFGCVFNESNEKKKNGVNLLY